MAAGDFTNTSPVSITGAVKVGEVLHPRRRRLDTLARLPHLPVAPLRFGRSLLREHRRGNRHELYPRRRRPRPDHPRRRDRHQDRLYQRHLHLGADSGRCARRPHQHDPGLDHRHRQGRGSPHPRRSDLDPCARFSGIPVAPLRLGRRFLCRPCRRDRHELHPRRRRPRPDHPRHRDRHQDRLQRRHLHLRPDGGGCGRRPDEHDPGLDHRHRQGRGSPRPAQPAAGRPLPTRAPTSGDAATPPAPPAPTSPAKPAPPTRSSPPTSARPSASSKPPARPPTTTPPPPRRRRPSSQPATSPTRAPSRSPAPSRSAKSSTRSAGRLDTHPRLPHLPVATLRSRRSLLREHRRRDRDDLHARRRRLRTDDPRRRDRVEDRLQQRLFDVFADDRRRGRRPHQHSRRSRSPARSRSAKSSPAPSAAGHPPPTPAAISGDAATPAAGAAPTSPARPAPPTPSSRPTSARPSASSRPPPRPPTTTPPPPPPRRRSSPSATSRTRPRSRSPARRRSASR